MTIQQDWKRVMEARAANAAPNATLPYRLYAACCYADECKAFIENNWDEVCMLMECLERGMDRAA